MCMAMAKCVHTKDGWILWEHSLSQPPRELSERFAGFRGKYFSSSIGGHREGISQALKLFKKPLKSSSYIHRLSFWRENERKPEENFLSFFANWKWHMLRVCTRDIVRVFFNGFFHSLQTLVYVLSCRNCFILDAHTYILFLTRQMLLLVAAPSCGSTHTHTFEFLPCNFLHHTYSFSLPTHSVGRKWIGYSLKALSRQETKT